jgi:uncharacterized membrane protein
MNLLLKMSKLKTSQIKAPQATDLQATELQATEPTLKIRGLDLLWVWCILGLGIGLRFINLTGKPVWIDEAFSLFHVSGFQESLVRSQLIETKPFTVAELMQYQFPNPQHSLMGTIDNIAKTAPELPPLYFILLNLWMTVFGKTVLAIRSLSAVISLFCFPTLYWLCWELFQLPIVGWYAMALYGVSPFNLLMAQEARPYSLWTLCFLVASAALLRAQRSKLMRDWGIYTIALLMAFYTHLFSLLLWLVYTAYIGVSERFRWTKTLRQYSLSNVLLGLGFLPWIWYGFILPGDPNHQPFSVPHPSILSMVKGLYRGIGLFFVDFNLNQSSPKGLFVIYLGVMGLILLLVGYSIWYLIGRSSRRTNAFLIITITLPILFLSITDVLLGASRTTMTRYFIPGGIAMAIVVAYTIASKQTFRFQSLQLWHHWTKRFNALLLVGLLSCTGFLLSPNWWHKDLTQENACILNQVDRLTDPLLVTDAYYVRAMALGHQLNPNVRFLFMPNQSTQAPQLALGRQLALSSLPNNPTSNPAIAAPTFLYLPTDNFLKAMQQRYQLQPVCKQALNTQS